MPPYGGSSRFLLLSLSLHHHAAADSGRVQLNSVPSIQMRCMITASRRAKATIAFFIPRRLFALHTFANDPKRTSDPIAPKASCVHFSRAACRKVLGLRVCICGDVSSSRYSAVP